MRAVREEGTEEDIGRSVVHVTTESVVCRTAGSSARSDAILAPSGETHFGSRPSPCLVAVLAVADLQTHRQA
ncbi:hypothetical protein BRD06_08065 [Halobacteriales archaeon QS_9_67_15]|nr:MAG: hypothetical protein BRD06_08065 [Halobacteriales archaeon QS_9_67_15]